MYSRWANRLVEKFVFNQCYRRHLTLRRRQSHFGRMTSLTIWELHTYLAECKNWNSSNPLARAQSYSRTYVPRVTNMPKIITLVPEANFPLQKVNVWLLLAVRLCKDFVNSFHLDTKIQLVVRIRWWSGYDVSGTLHANEIRKKYCLSKEQIWLACCKIFFRSSQL